MNTTAVQSYPVKVVLKVPLWLASSVASDLFVWFSSVLEVYQCCFHFALHNTFSFQAAAN